LKIPHVIPYQGSKRKLAPQILAFMPFRKIETFYEPFAGSAAVTLAAATSNKATRYIINDKFKPLAELWELIVNQPNILIEEYTHFFNSQLGNEKDYFFYVRELFNQTQSPSALFYLMTRCVKNSIRFNLAGEFNQSPDNRRLGMKPEKLKTEVIAASFLLKEKVRIFAEDFRKILRKATPNDFVYMDPPWQGTSGKHDSRYAYHLNLKSLIEELERLNYFNIPYLLSFDGKCGDKSYGKELPQYLALEKVSLNAGRSAQATLLGRNQKNKNVIGSRSFF
jgi:DNA adenine methylase